MPTTLFIEIATKDNPAVKEPGSHCRVVPDVQASVEHVTEVITRPVAVKSARPKARPVTVMMLLPVVGLFVIIGQAFVNAGAATSSRFGIAGHGSAHLQSFECASPILLPLLPNAPEDQHDNLWTCIARSKGVTIECENSRQCGRLVSD